MRHLHLLLQIFFLGGVMAALALESTVYGQSTIDIQSPDGDRLRVDWQAEVNGAGLILDQSQTLGQAPLGWRPFAIFPEETSGFTRSVTFSPLVGDRYFMLREDTIPTEVRRTDLDSRMEEISWDFTYRLVQLQTSTDGGATWQSIATPPSIHFESGEFYVVRPKPPEGELRIYRIRQNAPPSLTVPASATVDVGAQAVIDLMASDADDDLLRYEIEGLPEGASFNPLTNKISFRPGAASVGMHAVRISVSDSSASSSGEFFLTVPEPPVRATSALSGRVLDANAANEGIDVPIPGVTVSLLNTSAKTVTDAQGVFAFDDIPGGGQVLNFDPTAVTGPGGIRFAGFREDYAVMPLVDNQITRPIYLPRLATNSLTRIVRTETTVVENADIGVKLTVPAFTAMAGGSSSFTGELSISEVPRGFEPASMPPNLQPAQIVTIQPVGVTFSRPVPITFPNLTGLLPGTETDIWSLDAGTGQFVVVGVGEVSPDGQFIETISGGIVATDWHFPLPPSSEIEPAEDIDKGGAPPDKCPAGSEFSLHTGDLTTSFASPPWLSLGLPNELRFFYSSRQARPAVIIPFDIRSDVVRRTSPPLTIGVEGKFVGAGSARSPTWVSGENLLGDGSARTAVEIPAAALPTGVQSVELTSTSVWANPQSTARSGKRIELDVPVVNRSQSPYGMGWSVSGLQSIHVNPENPDKALVVDGDVTRVFRQRDDLSGGSIDIPADLTTTGVLASPVAADFDGDQQPDLALMHNLPGDGASLVVFKGRGDGSFEYLYRQPVTDGTLSALDTADLNGDGVLDLVLASYGATDTTIHGCLGQGNGGFTIRTTVDVPDVRADSEHRTWGRFIRIPI